MKMSKKLLSVLMCLAMLAGMFAVCGTFASAGNVYKVGDTLYYGSYPQTDVTEALGSTLDSMDGTWTNADYGTSVNMRYKDVVYNGEKYRGVIFDAYRAIFGKGAGSGFQEDNGYIKGNMYWFKYEPLRWRVLDPSTGFIFCDTAIDSQPFNYSSSQSGHYASNYAQSDIRAWLNADFYNTAFSEAEKSGIKTTELDNTSALSSDYDSASTNDKIFLLSWDEVTNSAYGFSSDPDTLDVVKRIKGTDYAKSQGLWYYKSDEYKNFVQWRLRTPWSHIFSCVVDYNGRTLETDLVTKTDLGICPAMKIQGMVGLTSIAVKTMPTKTTYNVGEIFLDPTGLTLTATYSDGSTKTVTGGFTCTGFDFTTAGTETITVGYQGKTTTFTITVNSAPVTLTSIAVKTMPTKFSYTVGESFNSSGLTLTATYSDSSTKTITSGFTCTGFSSAAPGISTVTVTYEGKTTTFDVTINPASATLSGIAVKTLPAKTVYFVGESFDQSGLTLTATYSDSSKSTVTEGFTCTGFSSSTPGTKTVTVTYKGKTTTFSVTVVAKDDPTKPVVNIKNFTEKKTVDYKTTITFTAQVKNAVSGASVHWFIDGKDAGTGDTYTVSKAKKTYTVQVKYIKDGKTLAESGVETVNVKTGFFAKLAAFFRSIFGKLPKIVQGYLGAEIIEKII